MQYTTTFMVEFDFLMLKVYKTVPYSSRRTSGIQAHGSERWLNTHRLRANYSDLYHSTYYYTYSLVIKSSSQHALLHSVLPL